MKTPKALLSLALSGCLLLAACGGGDGSGTSSNGATGLAGGNNGGSTTGRYIESNITPPLDDEDYSAQLLKGLDGNLIAFSGNLDRRFDSDDGGKTWTESAGPGAALDIDYCGSLVQLSDGSFLARIIQEIVENMTYESKMLHIAPDGTATELAFEGIEGDGYFPAMLPLADGRVFISFNGYGMSTSLADDGESLEEEGKAEGAEETTIDGGETAEEGEPVFGTDMPEEDDQNDENETHAGYGSNTQVNAIFDGLTGEKIKDIQGIGEYGVAGGASDGTSFYLVDYAGSVQAFDSDGNQLTASVTVPVDASSFEIGNLALGADGSIYALSSNGLYLLEEEGNQTLIEGAGYAFGDPSGTVESMTSLDDGSFLVSIFGSGGYQFYRYEWDPDATLDPDKIINVWALRDSNTLRAAIGKYREKYPDGLVNLEIALSDEGGVSAEDAIRTLNTEILSGSGPDVIMLDGTPMESYIDKGVLADLTGLVETGTYYQNLLEQAKGDSGLYFIPVRTAIPMLAANNGYEAGTMEEFLDLMQKSPAASTDAETSLNYLAADERSFIAFQNLNQLWEELWAANAPSIVKGDGLDTENLKTFLAYMKEISDYNGYGQMAADEYTLGGMMSFAVGGSAASTVEGSLMAHLVGSANASMFTADDVMILNYLRDQTSVEVGGLDEYETSGASFSLTPAIETGVWMPKLLAGMNASSQKQEVAAEFISILLSDDIQGARLADGFAVTKNGMEKQINSLNEVFEFYSGALTIDDFDALFTNLTTMNLVDEQVSEKVYNNAIAYCQGQLSLDEAVNHIEQDVKNYLAERQ